MAIILVSGSGSIQEIEKINAETVDDVIISEEPTIDAIHLISQLIAAEDSHDWSKYVSLWCTEEAEIYECLFQDKDFVEAREGVLNVETAKVMYCEKVIDEKEVFLEDYAEYDNVEAYLVGIEYSVAHVTEHFYNGINYRYIYTGKENGQYKILGCTEATVNELEKLSDNNTEGTLVYEDKNYSNNNAQDALSIRLDRIKKGYIEDGDGKVVEKLGDEEREIDLVGMMPIKYYSELQYCDPIQYNRMTYISRNGLCENTGFVQKMGYRGCHSATTSCNCYDRSTVKVLMTRTNNKVKEVTMKKYLKRVLNSEMVVSTTKDAALKAVMVCIHEYVYWNQVYYAKYPDAGYDVKDNASDQAYYEDKWADETKTPQSAKEKIEDIYEAVGEVHMHTGSHYSVFESGYVLNSEWDQDSYGTLYQEGAAKMAKNGKTYKQILHHYYDNTKQMGIKNIGEIAFKTFTNP